MLHEALRSASAPRANRRIRALPQTDRARPPQPSRSWLRLFFVVGALLIVVAGVTAFWWSIRTDLDAALERTEAFLDAQEAALRSIAPLTDREVTLLRRSRNAEHVRLAQALGIAPPTDRDAIRDSTRAALVRVRDIPGVVSSRMRYGVPYVTADAAAALDSIVARLEDRLRDLNVPSVRPVVTSALRTTEDQRLLAGVNANAARGRSSHEYATTFDLTYARFGRAPLPDALPDRLLPERAWLHRFIEPAVRDRIRERWAALATRYADRYSAELGRALIDLEDAGVLVVVRERRQPVYHVTVARQLTE